MKISKIAMIVTIGLMAAPLVAHATTQQIPEPGSLTLIALGLAGLAGIARRK